MWRMWICKMIFAICTDSLCINYLKWILFDLAYGAKGKKNYTMFRLNNSMWSRIMLRHAFCDCVSKSHRFVLYYRMYFFILLSIFPAYALLTISSLCYGNYFSWIDVIILAIKSIVCIILRMHFDGNNVSVFVRNKELRKKQRNK